MELLNAIFAQALINGDIQITFHSDYRVIGEIVEGRCYQTLQKIREILDDEALDDAECFKRIEKIVCALEEIGSNGGCRHDF